jgi:hypothetical protein
MAELTFFSSPPLGVERPGEAGVAAASAIEGSFSCDIGGFPTSPDLSAPMERRGETRGVRAYTFRQPG